jgi:hypothetical protein
VGPRAGLGDVEKRKFLALPGLELRPLGSITIPTTLSRLVMNMYLDERIQDYKNKWRNRILKMDSSRLTKKVKNYQLDGRKYSCLRRLTARWMGIVLAAE